jgi:sugar/nucleoside kinase (ribokinase family)
MESGRLGVVGTLVWDRIRHPADGARDLEDWGGAAYTLAALSAALPPGWEILPLLKLGEDLEGEARLHLKGLGGVRDAGVVRVRGPHNRVILDYADDQRRGERQIGGVPSWTADEIAPHLEGLDALLVNFISGQEVELATMQRVRAAFHGPIYADLHSLLLEPPHGGERRPRPLPSWEEWVRCFDAVQLNHEELATLAGSGDPWHFAAEALAPSTLLTLVTRGAEGARWLVAEGLPADPLEWPRHRGEAPAPRRLRDAPAAAPVAGDPTGCGDVWGGTLFARLLAGDALEAAIAAAQRAAARNAGRRGTAGLATDLGETLEPA